MARFGIADREHSGHYLTAVAVVTVVVAGLAWLSQNRMLAAAAAALGLYVLHLLSIRFLLDNQRRQRQVLDAQWEVLQQFLGNAEAKDVDGDELVPAMPVDREDPEKPVSADHRKVEASNEAHVAPAEGPVERKPAAESARWVEPTRSQPDELAAEPDAIVVTAIEPSDEPQREEPVVLGRLVPPMEAQSEAESSEPEARTPEDTEPGAHTDGPSLVGIPARPEGQRPAGTASEVPVPRHFALGTVALVRDLLTPAEVARVLLEQRRQPGKKFGELAVEMGMLSESQREELLLAQQEGLFTDAEMREARRRLREFRENAAHSMAGLD